MSKALIICTSALNYAYALCDENLDEHVVICANKEIENWVLAQADSRLKGSFVTAIHRRVYLKNALFDKNQDLNIFLSSHEIKTVYLAFTSGWHLFWLDKCISLQNIAVIAIDDGIGNIFKIETKFYLLKKFIATLLGRPSSISKYRDYNNKFANKILTIYSGYFEYNLSPTIEVICIRNEMHHFISRLYMNRVDAGMEYGLYLTSDQGVYKSNHDGLVEEIVSDIEKLSAQNKLKYILKCKATDPLITLYQERGLGILDSTINVELMLSKNCKEYVAGFDTFAINTIILGLPINLSIRENSTTSLLNKEKEKFVRKIVHLNNRQNVRFFA